MRAFKTSSSTVYAFSIACALLASLPACSDDGDGGDDKTEVGGDGDSGGDSAGAEGDSASKTIGPEGGTVSLSGASIEIPAGALEEDTVIAIEESPSDASVLYDFVEARSSAFAFLPHGLELVSPAVLTVPFTGDEADGLALFMAEEGGAWIEMTEATISGNAMQISIKHLSYGQIGLIGVDAEHCACKGAPADDGSYNCFEYIVYFSTDRPELEMICQSAEGQCPEPNTFLERCPSGASGRCTSWVEEGEYLQVLASYGLPETSLEIPRNACDTAGGIWEGK